MAPVTSVEPMRVLCGATCHRSDEVKEGRGRVVRLCRGASLCRESGCKPSLPRWGTGGGDANGAGVGAGSDEVSGLRLVLAAHGAFGIPRIALALRGRAWGLPTQYGSLVEALGCGSGWADRLAFGAVGYRLALRTAVHLPCYGCALRSAPAVLRQYVRGVLQKTPEKQGLLSAGRL